MVKIAVLMLTKNSERWLDAVLSPLSRQKGRFDVNLVLVDGYSNDGTVQKARSYFPDLVLVESISRNLAELRMLSLNAARKLKPDYMSFVDSDVQVPNDFFQRMIRLLDNPRVGIAGVRFELERDPPKHFVSKFYRDRRDITRRGVYECDYTTTACSMWKSERARNVKLDPRFRRAGEDVDFNLQILSDGAKAVIDADYPPAWHLRHASVREELHRVKDHGLARALLLHLHPRQLSFKRRFKTVVASALILACWIDVALIGWLGAFALLPFAVFYGRHWLKCKDKRRLDYAFFGFLMSVIFFTRFLQGVIQYWVLKQGDQK